MYSVTPQPAVRAVLEILISSNVPLKNFPLNRFPRSISAACVVPLVVLPLLPSDAPFTYRIEPVDVLNDPKKWYHVPAVHDVSVLAAICSVPELSTTLKCSLPSDPTSCTTMSFVEGESDSETIPWVVDELLKVLVSLKKPEQVTLPDAILDAALLILT